MRILYLINSLETGGAQTLVEGLCRSGRESGWEPHVAVLLERDTLSDRVETAADTVTYFGVGHSPWALVSAARQMRKLIRELKPEVIHSHLLQSDLVALIASGGVPHVTTIHTSGGHERSLGARVATRLVRSASRRFDAVVACSTAAADFTVEALGRRAISTILNAVAMPDLPDARPAQRFVLSLARWDPMKDHANLFRAMEAMGAGAPSLVCAGAGMSLDNAELAELLAEFPSLDVHLMGAVSAPQELLVKASCLVIASSHGEALPMAGIEALSFGVPVITTDVGDCERLAVMPWMVVEPRRPVALASALAQLQDWDWGLLSEYARRLANENFEIGRVCQQYDDIYRSVERARSR